jgi:hypothetical protein
MGCPDGFLNRAMTKLIATLTINLLRAYNSLIKILQHTNANNVEVQNMNLKQIIIILKIPTIITILNLYTKLHFYQQTRIVPKNLNIPENASMTTFFSLSS